MKTILIVDVQNVFIKPKIKGLPAAIRRHIDRNAYDHVLFSKFVNRKDSNFVKLLNWDKAYTSPDIDIAPKLADLSTARNTFTKTAYSAFKSPRLRTYLKKHRITQIDVCGVESDGCVLATEFEGFDLGYEIRVLNRLTKSTSTLDTATENIAKRNIDRQVKKR